MAEGRNLPSGAPTAEREQASKFASLGCCLNLGPFDVETVLFCVCSLGSSLGHGLPLISGHLLGEHGGGEVRA